MLPTDNDSPLLITRIVLDGETVIQDGQGTAGTAACPSCGSTSASVHDRYVRQPLDLPWRGHVVRVRLTVHRLRCLGRSCPRHTFTEPFGPHQSGRLGRPPRHVLQGGTRIGVQFDHPTAASSRHDGPSPEIPSRYARRPRFRQPISNFCGAVLSHGPLAEVRQRRDRETCRVRQNLSFVISPLSAPSPGWGTADASARTTSASARPARPSSTPP